MGEEIGKVFLLLLRCLKNGGNFFMVVLIPCHDLLRQFSRFEVEYLGSERSVVIYDLLFDLFTDQTSIWMGLDVLLHLRCLILVDWLHHLPL